MSIDLQKARDFVDNKITLSDIKRNTQKNLTKIDILSECFKVFRDSNELEIEMRKTYINKLKSTLQNSKGEKSESLFNRVKNLYNALNIDPHELKIELNSIAPHKAIPDEDFNIIFTHLNLDSVAVKHGLDTNGMRVSQSISVILFLINRFLSEIENQISSFSDEDRSEIKNVKFALQTSLKFSVVSTDYCVSEKRILKDHKAILDHLMLNTVNKLTDNKNPVPFVFLPFAFGDHSTVLKLMYNNNQNNFRVDLINTGHRANQENCDEFTAKDLIYNNIPRLSLELFTDLMMKSDISFDRALFELNQNLKSKDVFLESGRMHKTQQGYSCVLKSLMSAIHGSISNDVIYRKFKVYITNHLQKRAKKLLLNNHSDDLAKKITLVDEHISKKRDLKVIRSTLHTEWETLTKKRLLLIELKDKTNILLVKKIDHAQKKIDNFDEKILETFIKIHEVVDKIREYEGRRTDYEHLYKW